MDKAQKVKNLKDIRKENVLENLKGIGQTAGDSLRNDLVEKVTQDFFSQLVGIQKEKKYSGEITPGETLEFSEIYSGKDKENKKLRAQLLLERQLSQEEKARSDQKSRELKLKLHALIQEIIYLATTTQGLGEEVEVAAMQAPANPGIYHIIFFEKLIEFMKSFRKKIEDASIWLKATNQRAEKKNFWASYHKHGGSFLLSPDHYLQRSAG